MRRIFIKHGQVTGFADEVCFEGLTVVDFKRTRVSRVVPARWPLRIVFVAIRALVSDQSAAANWTRRWRCDWDVIIDGACRGPFPARSAAIDFEKVEIYRLGKLR